MFSTIKTKLMRKKIVSGGLAFSVLMVAVFGIMVLLDYFADNNILFEDVKITLKRIISRTINAITEYSWLILLISLILFIVFFVLHWRLNRKRKSITGSNRTINHVLAPLDDLYDEVEYENIYAAKLKAAFSNPNLTNIAIVGNFGVGKSSIIRSFEALQKKKKREAGYLYISMLDYKSGLAYNSGSKLKLNEEREELENYLLSHILARGNEVRLPDSGYKLIPKKYTRIYWWLTFSLLAFAFSGISALLFDKISPVLSKTIFHGETYHDIKPYIYLFMYLFMAFSAFSSSFPFLLLVRRKLTVDSINLKRGDSEASIKKKNVDTEYIDKRLFEMMYALENISKRIGHTVVIEDLDRLNANVCADIFSDICRVSKLVNARTKRKDRIRFIYAFNDEVFDKTKRYKFFDYVLSVYPVITRADAGKYMRERLISHFENKNNAARHTKSNKELNTKLIDILKNEMNMLWWDIGQCVYDMRLLNCIIDNFEVFATKMIAKGAEPSKQWLPYIIYINILPKDYLHSFNSPSILSKVTTYERNRLIKNELDGLSASHKDAVCNLFDVFINEEFLTEKFIYELKTENYEIEVTDENLYALKKYEANLSSSTNFGLIKKIEIQDAIIKLLDDKRNYEPVVNYCLRQVTMLKDSPFGASSYERDALHKLGEAYEKNAEYEKAIANYQSALDKCSTLPKSALYRSLNLALLRAKALKNGEDTSNEVEYFKKLDNYLTAEERQILSFHFERLKKYDDSMTWYSNDTKKLSEQSTYNNATVLMKASVDSDLGLVYYLKFNSSGPEQSPSAEDFGNKAQQLLKTSLVKLANKIEKDFPDYSSVYSVFGAPCIGKSAAERVHVKCEAANSLLADAYDQALISCIQLLVEFDQASLENTSRNTAWSSFIKDNKIVQTFISRIAELEVSGSKNTTRLAMFYYYLAKASSKNGTEFNDAVKKVIEDSLPKNKYFDIAVVKYSLGILLLNKDSIKAKKYFIEAYDKFAKGPNGRSKSLIAEVRQQLQFMYNKTEGRSDNSPGFDKWLKNERKSLRAG